MSKKDDQHRDSTTDFFLKFITKEKNDDDKKPKISHRGISEEYVSTKEKAVKAIFKTTNLLNTTLDKMLQSNLSIKILSFVLAVVLLFTVSGGSFDSLFSTPNGGDYIDEVEVNVEGLEDDYDVVGLPKTVSVGLIGPSIDIYTTKLSKDYEVYVDLSGLGEGEQTVELKYRDFPTNVEVMIVPQTVTVTITRKVTKTFDLGYRFIHEDEMDSQYSVSVNSLEHDKVEVRGSQDNIDKVYSVEARIDLSGITDSFTQQSDIRAYDRSGKRLDVEVIPATVAVDCTVSNYSKTVPIEPDYTGVIADGYGIESVDFSKEQVEIFGEAKNLENITSVQAVIDINGLSSDTTFKDVKLKSIDGVNKMSLDSVEATVHVSTATTRTFDNIPIEVENNDQGFEVSFISESVASINVSGVESVLSGLDNDDIYVSIDVQDLKRGRHLVPLVVELNNKSLTYIINGSQEVSITMTN